MYPTAEVRWFWRKPLPQEVRQWFQTLPGPAMAADDRQDWYLYLPKTHALSIKLRQGSVEVKGRIADRGVQRFACGVKGHMEQWTKWRFELKSEPDIPDAFWPAGSWIAVEKSRQQKVYEVVNGTQVKEATSRQKLAHGCSVEIAELSIQGQTWCSLGFEAFGTADRIEQTLQRVANEVLSTPPFSALKPKHSFSYPGWLSKLE